jgi:hypothetical protein
MRARSLLAASVLAAASVVAGAVPAWAGDTINLNLANKDTNTPTVKLGGSGIDADTLDVRGGGRGGYGGGRGGYGGYRGGFYGGYRGGYYGGYRGGFYGYGGYYGYGPIYRSYYYSPVIYTYPSLYYTAPYYTPIVGSTVVTTPTVTLSIGGSRPSGTNLNIAPNAVAPQGPPPSGDQTFPYDGGPRQPIPMPKATDGSPAPSGGAPAPNVPLDGRTVSVPSQKPAKLTYPAYGDQTPTQDRTSVVRLAR